MGVVGVEAVRQVVVGQAARQVPGVDVHQSAHLVVHTRVAIAALHNGAISFWHIPCGTRCKNIQFGVFHCF